VDTTIRQVLVGVLVAAGWLGPAGTAGAQGSDPLRPAPVVEASGGWAGFGDEGIVDHGLIGAGARFYLLRWVSIGPEIQVMAGPASDRDLLLTGNVVVDLLPPSASRPRRTTPYVVAGGGLFNHSDGRFSSSEGGFTLGAGVRGWVNERVFLAADARLGWEPHLRVAGTVGFALGR
jgi:hypothetical protein